MSTVAELSDLIKQLTFGFNERIEYKIRVAVHTEVCKEARNELPKARLTHFKCDCPEVVEPRTETRLQKSLIEQLKATKVLESRGGSSEAVRSSHPVSRPPTDLSATELLLWISEQAVACRTILGYASFRRMPLMGELTRLPSLASSPDVEAEAIDIAADIMRRVVKSARIILGYEVPKKVLKDTYCGDCGSELIVAEDASSDVKCVDRNCGTVYHQWQWVEILKQMHDERAREDAE